MLGKDIILKYCDTVETHDINHLENCLDNGRLIKELNNDINIDYGYFCGCPSSCGLDFYFEGLCHIEDVDDNLQDKQCEQCWKEALEGEFEL